MVTAIINECVGIRTSDRLNAVGEKRAWKKVLEFIVRPFRQAGFLLLNLILRQLVWGILRIVRIFDYIFLVYPGSPSDLDGYCPRRIAQSWMFLRKLTLGGIITKGQAGVRGIYFVVPDTIRDFLNHEVSLKIKNRLLWIKKILGDKARAIAIAGQVPGIMARNSVSIEKPFVRGNKGTVFCVMETIAAALNKHERKPAETSIVVVGVGYVGGLLLKELRNEGYNAIGLDVEIKEGGYVSLDEDARMFLPHADMIVVLTPKGSDFAPYVKFLKKGAIVIDDTHPKITEKPVGVHFYKVAVGMKDVHFFPRLPGYASDWIPGCAVEAIFSAATGEFNGCSQREFNERARKLGFFAHLVR